MPLDEVIIVVGQGNPLGSKDTNLLAAKVLLCTENCGHTCGNGKINVLLHAFLFNQ